METLSPYAQQLVSDIEEIKMQIREQKRSKESTFQLDVLCEELLERQQILDQYLQESESFVAVCFLNS